MTTDECTCMARSKNTQAEIIEVHYRPKLKHTIVEVWNGNKYQRKEGNDRGDMYGPF